MTSNPLIKTVGLSAAILVVFLMTLAALFMRSKTVFEQILNQPKPTGLTPAQLASVEHKQFVYWNFRTAEINKMIKDLAEEREALKTREAELTNQEARVTSERRENERMRQDIERNRKELSDYIIQIKNGETARIKDEVAILNNMAPESIVTVFNEKTDAEAVKILAQMKADVVAQILETMMAQPPATPDAEPPQKRAARLLELLKRLRGEEAAK
jgi:septal ring factor EnvC (AmiA/AmiB activator)